MGAYVIHIREMRQHPGAVYIGRPRAGGNWQWGNPFTLRPGQSRDEVLSRYMRWFLHSTDPRATWQRDNLHTLRGRPLACFCRGSGIPREHGPACHGDILAFFLGAAEIIAEAGEPWPVACRQALVEFVARQEAECG